MDKRKAKKEALASEQARKECSVPPVRFIHSSLGLWFE